jgi:RNA polymerase sigma factor (sigma-70 family)
LKTLKSFKDFNNFSPGGFRAYMANAVQWAIEEARRSETALKRGTGNVPILSDISLSATFFAGSGPTPSELVSQRELNQRIAEALLSLKERDRDLLVDRYLCGLTPKEIAQRLQLTDANKIRVACSHARERLRKAVVARLAQK